MTAYDRGHDDGYDQARRDLAAEAGEDWTTSLASLTETLAAWDLGDGTVVDERDRVPYYVLAVARDLQRRLGAPTYPERVPVEVSCRLDAPGVASWRVLFAMACWDVARYAMHNGGRVSEEHEQRKRELDEIGAALGVSGEERSKLAAAAMTGVAEVAA